MPRVYRSDNNGDSWSLIFARRSDSTVGNPYNVQPGWLDFASFGRGFAAPMLGIAVASSNADEVLVGDRFGPSVTTDGGDAGGCARLIGTVLGAEIDDWAERFTAQDGFDASGRRLWTSIGIEPTTCFQYLVDPHDNTHHYICYTDVGFHESDGSNVNSAGIDWRLVEAPSVGGKPPFINFNQLAVDSATGAQWAAVSEQHDIPFESQLGGATGGGVLAFRGSAAEPWQDGQLNGDTMSGPVVSVAIDETSPPENRTLWASVWGEGIYRRVGSGAWTQLGAPPIPATNNCYRIQPWTNGRVLLVTAAHGTAAGLDASGSLWSCSVSTDANGNPIANWTNIGSGLDALAKGGSFTCPVDFAVDPSDQKRILVCTQHVDKNVGGVFETRDEGTTWNEVSGGLNQVIAISREPTDGRVQAFAPFFNGGPRVVEIAARRCRPRWPSDRLSKVELRDANPDPSGPDDRGQTTIGRPACQSRRRRLSAQRGRGCGAAADGGRCGRADQRRTS